MAHRDQFLYSGKLTGYHSVLKHLNNIENKQEKGLLHEKLQLNPEHFWHSIAPLR